MNALYLEKKREREILRVARYESRALEFKRGIIEFTKLQAKTADEAARFENEAVEGCTFLKALEKDKRITASLVADIGLMLSRVEDFGIPLKAIFKGDYGPRSRFCEAKE